jgi:hypothetical protein
MTALSRVLLLLSSSFLLVSKEASARNESVVATFAAFHSASAQAVELHDLGNCPSCVKSASDGHMNHLLCIHHE